MNAVFRHLTARFWATAFVGTLCCLAILPWLQRLLGLQLVVIPVSVILLVFFILFGWVMNRLGLFLVGRRLKEAAVWEGAGMRREAEAAYEQVVAVFDGFWLSPLLRQKSSRQTMARLSRFYLAQTSLSQQGRSAIRHYLKRYPQDQAVALGWLEHLLAREDLLQAEQETVDRLGEVHAAYPPIRQLVLDIYLAAGRADFNALHTYRNAWRQKDFSDDHRLTIVAHLLLNEGWLNHWVLQIYLEAYQRGAADCLEGVLAGACRLPVNPENQEIVMAARKIVGDVEPARQEALTRRFRPPQEAAPVKKGKPVIITPVTLLQTFTRIMWSIVSGSVRLGIGIQRLSLFTISQWRTSETFRRATACGGIVVVLAGIVTAGWRIAVNQQEVITSELQVPQPVAETVNPVTDPFTIQVAAYLKPEDAKRFVAQLKEQGLDAFWTAAISAQRKWYQVKVSHFATKAMAQQYGDQLKTKGLIDDFYVANYDEIVKNGS